MARAAPAGRPGRLPLHVRAMGRLLARGLPEPTCPVTVEPSIPVPAGDGVPLLTDHYIPLAAGPRPAVLVRSPLGRGFPWDYLYGALLAGHGFHVIIQSCRGTGGSGGTFDPWRHERADGQAAVAWLREQEWFSGALATIGTSYLGYTQWALAADPPPELRAMVVDGSRAPYPFFYPGGAFALENALAGAAGYLSFGRGPGAAVAALLRLRLRHRQAERTLPLIDAYPAALGRRAGFFEQWLTGPDPDDPYWDHLDMGAAATGRAVPVSLLSGWDDACLDQTLEQYRQLRAQGGEARLVVGPWNHTAVLDKGWPAVFAGTLPWLRARLAGEPASQPGQPVRVHVGGCGEWRDLPGWPPPQARIQPWYLDPDGALGLRPPAQAGSSSFRYDPADPTPSVGGQLLSRKAGAVDNRALEARADVLTFTSAPLASPLEVIGPVSAQLRVGSSSPHFDLFARLCDVDPQGHSRNVCDGLLRPRPAPGSGTAAAGPPASPGGSAITVAMSATAYRFAAGHRLRLQISGGAHPRFARNTGTAEPPATATRLVPVDIQVLHHADAPGTLSLPVVD